MRWFSHRHSRAREERRTGRRPRGQLRKKMLHFRFLSLVTLTFEPKFKRERDFCTVHLTATFHHPMFNCSDVIVRTNWQTKSLFTRYNLLSNGFDSRLNIYMHDTTVAKPVWQPVVSCIQTFNRLCLTTTCIVYTAGCTTGLTTGVTASCIV